ncbi:hypothetical protein M407DRAFT_12818 [Tulasnella calospora MUT 4182]|uniref:Uncharacterized protein n=1 Tax=Tulasnella calospora MUT 4182 TaxID=1051891 RepID=A0A0C3L4B7_9AGAM|nr:hypothetical protein M407DRAFT_12818 [Tulasnella calospora MUT 4182]
MQAIERQLRQTNQIPLEHNREGLEDRELQDGDDDYAVDDEMEEEAGVPTDDKDGSDDKDSGRGNGSGPYGGVRYRPVDRNGSAMLPRDTIGPRIVQRGQEALDADALLLVQAKASTRKGW